MANIRCDKPDVSADRIWLGNHVELLADSFLDVPAETLPEDMN
jgi:aromatic ring-cleaving dioxygenase